MALKIEWNIDLSGLMGKEVRVETLEGHVRTGTLTGVRFTRFKLEGSPVDYPNEVEMNGEDSIPFVQISSIKRA